MIRIEDYFAPVKSDFYKYEILELRNQINSFATVQEQYDFLVERRKSKEAVDFDYTVFGFSKNEKIYPYKKDELNENNAYYNTLANDVDVLGKENKKVKKSLKIVLKALFFTLLPVIIIVVIISVVCSAIGFVGTFGKTPFIYCNLDSQLIFDSSTKSITDGNTTLYIPGVYSDYPSSTDEDNPISDDQYSKDTESRGFGKAYKMSDKNAKRAKIDTTSDYVIVMRWGFASWYWDEENNKIAYVGNTINDELRNKYFNQKIIVKNHENNKSVVCEISNTGYMWGPTDPDVICSLSEAAYDALNCTPDTELDISFVKNDANSGTLQNSCQYINYDNSGTALNVDGSALSSLSGNGDAGFVGYCAQFITVGWSNGMAKSLSFSTTYNSLLSEMGYTSDDCRTACASFVSLMLYKYYGDIQPTAAVITLRNELDASSNYEKSYFSDIGMSGLQPGDILLIKGDGHSHVYMYAGADITGDANKPFFSASLHGHGPILSSGSYKSSSSLMVYRRKT